MSLPNAVGAACKTLFQTPPRRRRPSRPGRRRQMPQLPRRRAGTPTHCAARPGRRRCTGAGAPARAKCPAPGGCPRPRRRSAPPASQDAARQTAPSRGTGADRPCRAHADPFCAAARHSGRPAGRLPSQAAAQGKTPGLALAAQSGYIPNPTATPDSPPSAPLAAFPSGG